MKAWLFVWFFIISLTVVAAGIDVNFRPAGSGGSDTFLNLTDVFETTYAGAAGQVVQVNALETGLEFVDLPSFYGTRAFTTRVGSWGGGTIYLSGNGIAHSSVRGYRMPADGYIKSISQEIDVQSFSGLAGSTVTSQARINNAVGLSTSSPLFFGAPTFVSSSNVAANNVVSFSAGDLIQVSASHTGGGVVITSVISVNIEVVFI